jgi:hypothetical protein
LRVSGGVCFRGSVDFELLLWFLSFSYSFRGFAVFVPFIGFAGFLLLDDLLELFFGFWSSSYASWGLGFKLQTLCLFVINGLIKEEIKKQVISSLVCL